MDSQLAEILKRRRAKGGTSGGSADETPQIAVDEEPEEDSTILSLKESSSTLSTPVSQSSSSMISPRSSSFVAKGKQQSSFGSIRENATDESASRSEEDHKEKASASSPPRTLKKASSTTPSLSSHMVQEEQGQHGRKSSDAKSTGSRGSRGSRGADQRSSRRRRVRGGSGSIASLGGDSRESQAESSTGSGEQPSRSHRSSRKHHPTSSSRSTSSNKASSSSSSSRPRRARSSATTEQQHHSSTSTSTHEHRSRSQSRKPSALSSSSRRSSHGTAAENDSSSEEEMPMDRSTESSGDVGDLFANTNNAFGGADPFGGDAFATFDTTNMATTQTTNSPSKETGGMEVDFAAFPTDFGTTDSNIGFLDEMETPMESFDGNAFASATATATEKVTKKVYDKTPIANPPKVDIPNAANITFGASRPLLENKCDPAPVANPLTGNPIICRRSKVAGRGTTEWRLVEWNAHTQTQTTSVPLFSMDLQRKITQKYGVSAASLDSVLKVTVGVHQSQGYIRTRVACLLDVLVLENNEVLRVIAIWQWGYGGETAATSSSNTATTAALNSLQSIMSPPSGSAFTYNTDSLLVADSCIFVSGSSTKGPCVFLCKPTVRETWSANFVGKEAARISSMAVTTTTTNHHNQRQRSSYLAIGLTDGSLSVWTYEAATKISSKTTEVSKRLLFPLARLEWKPLRSQGLLDWDSGNADASPVSKEVGYCTDIQWVSPRASSFGQMLMLAAGYQGGVCVYHFALPMVRDNKNDKSTFVDLKLPTSTTQLSSTCTIPPFAMARWDGLYNRTSVGFYDLSPHSPPTLSVLLNGRGSSADYARLALVTCQLPMHSSTPIKGSKELNASVPMHLWDSMEWHRFDNTYPRGLIPGAHDGDGILYFSEKQIQVTALQKILNCGGIGSVPAGLTTSGGIHLSDSRSDKDGIFHVYTTLHCERRKREEFLEWTFPSRRHWLVATLVGDCKSSTHAKNSGKEEKEEEVVYGGSSSSVVCELGGHSSLSSSKLFPQRLIRNSFVQSQAAVSFGSFTNDSDDAVIAMIDRNDSDGKDQISSFIDGRALVFLPPEAGDPNTTLALVVDKSCRSLSLWQKKENRWDRKDDEACRPILGSDETVDNYFACLDALLVHSAKRCGLLMSAVKGNGIACVIMGSLIARDDLQWHNMLPNIETDPLLSLEVGEVVVSLQCLPYDKESQGALVVVTSSRIILVSHGMTILAEAAVRVPPTSIVPLGAFTVAFCSQDDHNIQYLSALNQSFGRRGTLAALPLPRFNYCPHHLLAIRPDRFLYTHFHSGARLVEKGQPSNVFLLPRATTRPALLLEPMIANAIATGGSATNEKPFLRSVVEKFGRKLATMTHGEGEGIGNNAAGLTPKTFELLQHYGLQAASAWLLTGTILFDRSANSRLLPPWAPASAKAKAALSADMLMHIIANGDQYFSEYIKSPDNNMSATLPRPSDPSSYLSKQFAFDALGSGNALDGLKMLDLAGMDKTDAMMVQLALAMQADKRNDVTPFLAAIQQPNGQVGRSTPMSIFVAIAMELKKANLSRDFTKKWAKTLAPSFQKGRGLGRARPRIIGESSFSCLGKTAVFRDKLFSTETSESRHVWNEGPNKEKENLLLLDHIQEWFGRHRPIILGKEGAKNAEDRGASTLADILAQPDDDSFGGDEDNEMEDGWTEGVGEGLNDEDKLSAYFRFSEGEDEDSNWREDGFADISRFDVHALLANCAESVSLQESTSSVDEGESGKVKALYDLVFEKSGVGKAAGVSIPATRGGSLDVGMMHGPDHSSRQKCSTEFWFWLPRTIDKKVVLCRRTFGPSADDVEIACRASDKSAMLWELVVSTKGELLFSTVSGDSLQSHKKKREDDDDDEGPTSTITFGRWNHVCITFRQETTTNLVINILAKGVSCASGTLSCLPPNFETDEFSGASAFDPLLEKSRLVFGLDHPASFRMTETRVWAIERDDDDVRRMMTEYLECAETKRKLRVKIKKKGGEKSKAGLLPVPKGAILPTRAGAALPKKTSLLPAPAKGVLAPPADASARTTRKGLLAPPKDKSSEFEEPMAAATPDVAPSEDTFNFDGSFGGFKDSPGFAFGESGFGEMGSPQQQQQPQPDFQTPETYGYDQHYSEDPEISPLWDSAIPLSEQVRSSAAAALIRGPPATRHFGGNRGGLPDYRELDRYGVGAISICGSEKTIVWRDDQVPPGLTYPIGASGAIVSDQMDEEGSEFLCCFLAKDKRMVVFELSTRTVVVELQMTTKLNYWRFLPPEAGEDTLCFMLVTPVGGFHWMPLDESPRPRQVWKRGVELQGKKIVSYEEGGTNGHDGPDMLSKVGMLLVTNASTGGQLESWLVPICGDSQAICASDDVLGACLCRPPDVGYEAWMPLLLFVVEHEGDLVVCISAVTEAAENAVGLTDVMTDALIELVPYDNMSFEPPTLAMGRWPEVLCCSLGSTIVIIVRRKGLVVAYELAETGLELIAQENVGHFVVDAVMRYSASEGGAEIVLLMSDSENPRDGRVGTFCFRNVA